MVQPDGSTAHRPHKASSGVAAAALSRVARGTDLTHAPHASAHAIASRLVVVDVERRPFCSKLVAELLQGHVRVPADQVRIVIPHEGVVLNPLAVACLAPDLSA